MPIDTYICIKMDNYIQNSIMLMIGSPMMQNMKKSSNISGINIKYPMRTSSID